MGNHDQGPQRSFRDLHREELSSLHERDLNPDSLKIECDVKTDEPHVRSTPVALVGLAISGGGIRSATFGLGASVGPTNGPGPAMAAKWCPNTIQRFVGVKSRPLLSRMAGVIRAESTTSTLAAIQAL
jgi:hypothetical protein